MTREEITRMARDAGLDPDLWNYTDAFERFAALVADAERDALLEALKIVIDDLMYKDHARVIGVARAAIAKAEGEKT